MCEHKNIKPIKSNGKIIVFKCYECGYEKVEKKQSEIKKKTILDVLLGR